MAHNLYSLDSTLRSMIKKQRNNDVDYLLLSILGESKKHWRGGSDKVPKIVKTRQMTVMSLEGNGWCATCIIQTGP